MFFILFFSIYTVIIWKYRSVSTYLSLLLILTVIFAYITNYIPDINSIEKVFSVIFIIINLFILILPYIKYKGVICVKVTNVKKLNKLAKIILWINLFALTISLIFVVFIWLSVTDYSLFKGQPSLQQDVFKLVPISTKYLTLSSLFASTSFFSLGLHFYYLSCSQYKKAFLYIVASFALPVRMLVYFSRSALILFILLYFFYTILFFPLFNKKTKKIFRLFSILFIAIFTSIFLVISINRFSINDSVDNGTINSFLTYGGQWYKHGVDLLSNYSFNTLKGELSDSFVDWIKSFFVDKTDISNRELRMKIWPYHYYKFNGLITIMVYDFGLFCTFIFSILYALIVYSLRPKNGEISIFTTLTFGVLITIPAMSFVGNYFEDHLYGSAVFLSILIYLYFNVKTR